MVKKPPLPHSTKPIEWKTTEELEEVKKHVEELRKKWKWTYTGQYDPLTHLIDRTLIGLEIRIGDQVDSLRGTVKSLKYFSFRDTMYCDLWINSMQVEKHVCLSDSPFYLTAMGKKNWEDVLSRKTESSTTYKGIELQLAPDNIDCWLDDIEIDGLFYAGQQAILQKEKERPTTRETNYFLMRSTVYHAALKAIENDLDIDEEMDLLHLMKEEGDKELRCRLLIPAGSGSHWCLLIVNIFYEQEVDLLWTPAAREINVQVVDSLRAVVDADLRQRAVFVPGKVSFVFL